MPEKLLRIYKTYRKHRFYSNKLKVMIKFRFQLNEQYFISIVKLLYMFRAPLRPSSGGPLHIYNIWFYVSLFW